MTLARLLRTPMTRGVVALAVLAAVGLVLIAYRFYAGLGAVTNLSDGYPWGFWIGMDILAGIALAAGGFVLAGTVHIFGGRRFHALSRPAILTALLGYLLFIFALMVDLGRPWNIWRALINWNHASPMFEVSWCVMLYLTVLALEFSGVVFERLGWKRALVVQHAATVPLVIAGAIISTLHQSSLGSFYLIMPAKLHPLWYTPYLPVMFFLSAFAGGLAMMIIESRISSRALGRGLEMPLLMSIGKALGVALAVYGAARLADLASRGVLAEAFSTGREAFFFQLELGIGVILPMALLALPAVRRNSGRLYGAALLVVAGFIMDRLNVSITGLEGAQGGRYFPTAAEGIITIMLVAIGVAAFGLAVRFLPIMARVEQPELLAAAPERPAGTLAAVPARS
jgi:Ni/Fe-hydrogenase subunit HybB-like protein